MSEEIELIRVPDFGIKGFVTFKERNNAAFRPSATHMIASMAYSNALSEGLEESDMNHYVPVEISGEINFENYKHIEFIGDTSWYNHRKKYVELINIDDSLDVALFPKDLVLFKATYCLEDKKELHWSNSGGYSHDTNKIIALNKGKSEIIEHHTKMFWWFGQSNIIERRVKSSVFEQLKKQRIITTVRVFEILESRRFSYSTFMAVLQTNRFPFLSVGFGTNTEHKSAIDHALLEAVHTFRGENWYNLFQTTVSKDFSKDFWDRVNRSLVTSESEIVKIESSSVQPKFYYLDIGNSSRGYTTRVYSPELQPLVSNEFVPFYFKKLCTSENSTLRQKYRGTPYK